MTPQEMRQLLNARMAKGWPFQPFTLRPIDPIYKNAGDIVVPDAIAHLLSQFDKVTLVESTASLVCWSCQPDPVALKDEGRSMGQLQEKFFAEIFNSGGAVIDGEQLTVMFPASHQFIRDLLLHSGFGIDQYGPGGAPLEEELNSPERVKARLHDFLAIFDAMLLEFPVLPIFISEGSIRLEAQVELSKAASDKWAATTWGFAVKHFTMAKYHAGLDPDFPSKKKCYQHAQKRAFFHFGHS